MNRINPRFFVERRDFGRHIALHLSVEDQHGQLEVATPVVFTKFEDHVITPPALELHPEGAQRLMDELWNVGFRPTQGKQSEGQVSAIDGHLQDMRAIAFAKLEVPKP